MFIEILPFACFLCSSCLKNKLLCPLQVCQDLNTSNSATKLLTNLHNTRWSFIIFHSPTSKRALSGNLLRPEVSSCRLKAVYSLEGWHSVSTTPPLMAFWNNFYAHIEFRETFSKHARCCCACFLNTAGSRWRHTDSEEIVKKNGRVRKNWIFTRILEHILS